MILRGFLQAGGGSTRFGTDKALVQLSGKSMLRRAGDLLASVCDELSIVAPAGRYANETWPVISDRWPGEGPLGGILTALATIRTSEPGAAWALIVSCDMPFLSREFLAYLSERAMESNAEVVVPQSAGGLEPLCACWRASAVAGVQSAFDSGVRKVTEAMKLLTREVLDESAWKRFDTDGRLFWNMNTPEDFAEARRILETPNR
ncbi:MAG: molybdenum cofactor guanylyltransferase [Candidatus Acidiferrum sp.]